MDKIKKFLFIGCLFIFLCGFDNTEDMYYNGDYSCIKTDKLKLILLKYNDCVAGYDKLKVDYNALKEIKDLELKTCQDKCNAEVDMYKKLYEKKDSSGFLIPILYVSGGFTIGVILTTAIFIFR